MAPQWFLNILGRDTGCIRLTRDKLCSTCSRFDFQALLQSSCGQPGKWTGRIPLKSMLKDRKCPFCRLVLETILASTGGYARRASLDMFTDDHGQVCFEREVDEYWHDERLGVRRHVPRIAVRDCGNQKYYIHMLQDFDGFLSSDFLRGRRVGSTVSADLLKTWIRDCERLHGRCCAPPAEKEKPRSVDFELRYIDVEQRRIVNNKGCKYIALSYVRGSVENTQILLQKGTSQRLFEKGGLSNLHSDIPTTINDAMSLCKYLGRQYLWVEALCIYQDDPNEKAFQLANMHRIYEQADLTVVCARGVDSRAGLPGITPRDTQQHIEAIQGLRMSNLLCDFDEAITSSLWNTCAWALQAKLFSRRLLYFTDQQVYFECGQVQWQEDRVFEVEPDVQISRDKFAVKHSAKQELWKPSPSVPPDWPFDDNYHLTKYHDLLDNYTSRELTNPNDILNAFTSIITKFSEIWDCDFFWGLPVKFLDNELMFCSVPGEIRHRREGFPSWSWAGWQGEEGCRNERHVRYLEWNWNFYSENSWYRVQHDGYIQLENTGVRCDEEVFGEPGSERSLKAVLAKPKKLPSILSLPSVLPFLTEAEKGRVLVFNTTTVFLTMACPGDESYHDPRCRGCAAFAPSRSSKPLATIRSTVLSSDLSQGKMEFVLLGNVSYIDGDESDDEEVILMALKTDERGISERVDMPREPVLKSRWDACRPESRTVFLI